MLFRYFEQKLDPTGPVPPGAPPESLPRFYWHYVRQARSLLPALFIAGSVVALLDASIPVFLGRVVSLITAHDPRALLREAAPQLIGMAAVLLVLRPLAIFAQYLVSNQALGGGLTNLIRWQSHWHVVRQSWTFFQNDFAGRIANRVMQVGPAMRESVISATNAVWYILVYGTSAMLLLGRTDWVLTLPIMAWFACYACFLRFFVPRMRERSRRISEARSNLTGRIVDSYTNILTVKLFARADEEDDFVQAALADHTGAYRRQLRMLTGFICTLQTMNALMVVGTGTVAVLLWSEGRVQVGIVAMALPLAWQIASMAGWVAQNVTAIFENVGVVQDGMRSISVPWQMPDPPDAGTLALSEGAIRFEHVSFDYGRTRGAGGVGVLREFDLAIAPGERVGLVGRSGAGKSTLVNLLLHFHAPERGRILIDGQDITTVTQESLRAQIGMVTQDTSLLHRSIRDNIRYGRPDASEEEIRAAAAQAHALEFIETLEDWHGRSGFEAHVGERGVKLSGGQRQRIAIARVILKDAPILVLDEATSALDSEVEAAIQEQLAGLMEGRTVIAIAHRLSTIAQMDRLIVLDQGRIIEQGTHAALLAANGAYAALWRRQSGGFRSEEADENVSA